MIKDVVSFDQVWSKMYGSSSTKKAIASFVHFLERRLGGEFMYDQTHIGYESFNLKKIQELAEAFRSRGIIRFYKRDPGLVDEPRMAAWYAEYSTGEGHEKSGGSSLEDHSLALTKTLAEALERHVWFTHNRFPSFRSATIATMEEKDFDFLNPGRFASYSESQRKKKVRLQTKPTDSFLWVKGYSWTKKKSSWVPKQVVSAHRKKAPDSPAKEPLIRPVITTGLATHPLRIKALLSGALEVIERDAYIITWLNQLSPSRIDTTELALRSESLAKLLAHCRKYRLEPHILRLPTDAPTYVLSAVLEDMTGMLPRFTIGLKADRDPALAAEGAILESLRTHQRARWRKTALANDWDPNTKASAVKNHDQLLYWSEGTRGDRLAFLIKGNCNPLKQEKWEVDTDEENFERIVAWCKEKEYELVSVSSTNATANLPGWHIEFVVIPELQPLYHNEKLPCLGGKRLRDIPQQFGYTSREPYLDDPQPFD